MMRPQDQFSINRFCRLLVTSNLRHMIKQLANKTLMNEIFLILIILTLQMHIEANLRKNLYRINGQYSVKWVVNSEVFSIFDLRLIVKILKFTFKLHIMGIVLRENYRKSILQVYHRNSILYKYYFLICINYTRMQLWPHMIQTDSQTLMTFDFFKLGLV